MEINRGRSEAREGMKLAQLALFVVLLLSTPVALQAQTTLSMTLDETLTVGGVTPGGAIALLGVTHQTEDFHARLERVLEIVMDDDVDGAVQVAHDLLALPTSVWIAVDLTSGAVGTIAGAPEFDPTSIATPQLNLNAGGTAGIGIHLGMRGAVEGLWVRPGAGYWEISAVDGGAGEAEGAPDGDLDLPCTLFTDNLQDPDPPASLVNADVLVLVDPWTLDWSVIRGKDLGLPDEQ